MYFVKAPQNASYPYIVFSIVSGTRGRTFTEELVSLLIQFNIYSDQKKSADEVTAIATAIKATYDELDLDIAGFVNGRSAMIRENEIPTLIQPGSGIWMYAITYSTVLEKSKE